MKLTVITSLCVAIASIPASYAAVLGPEPTAAPRLQKRVFPTGSAAVASFLATIDPAELSTYFSWAANGNVGFISHAQSFTSANAAQYSSYLAGKSIDAAQASGILGGIETKSTQGGGGAGGAGGASSATGSGASGATSGASGSSSSAASGANSSSGAGESGGLTTLANGAVVRTLSNGDAIQGISLSQGNSLIPVSTTGAGGSLVPASTTYLSGATFLTPVSTSTTAGAATGAAGGASSSAVGAATSGTPDGSLRTLSLNLASVSVTLFAALLAACLVL